MRSSAAEGKMHNELDDRITDILLDDLKKHYNFIADRKRVGYIAKHIRNQTNMFFQADISSKDLIFRAVRKFYKTTKIPSEDWKMHSAFGFANWLNRNYRITLTIKEEKHPIRDIVDKLLGRLT